MELVYVKNYLNSINGHHFVVEASCGHIRYFEDGINSIDVNNGFKPTYSIIANKSDVVKKLREQTKNVDEVIIATDQDLDGTGKILPLVLVWFHTFWPNLYTHGFIKCYRTFR